MLKKVSSQVVRSTQRLRASNWHKHPLFIPVVTFLVLFFVTLVGLVILNGRQVMASDSHTIIFTHDGKHETLPTRATTVGDFLQRVNVSINEGDVVEPSQDTQIDNDNFHINVYRGRPVLIIDNGQKSFAFSAASTPRSIADQAGVKIYPEDNLNTEMSTDFLKDGSMGKEVVIDRATPVALNVYGTPLSVRTHAKTVGALLKEKNVNLAKDDVVQPSLTTPITTTSQIFVTRNGTSIQTREEPIPMQVQYVDDQTLSFGTQAVRQAGSAGKKLVTYQIDLVNGKEVGRHIIQTVTAVDQVTQIIARGRAVYIATDHESIMSAAGISPSDYPYVDYIVGHESGWCPTKLQGHPGACPAYAPASIPSGLGYGLCQSTPGSKMASAGADWQANPVTQLRWCTGYASRYGGWAGAYNFWLSHHWW
jgi:uncharacterized protein YabE (DUF348 family)